MGDTELRVSLNDQPIAILSLEQQTLAMQYLPAWQASGFPLSPHLPLQENLSPSVTQRFIRNLFPEGNSFHYLLENYHISRNNTFGLIRILGTDTASGLVFAHDQLITPTHFRPISAEELIARLDTREQRGLVVWDEKPRLSVAGVQDKINVLLDENGQLGFGEGELCSTHLLKFEQRRHAHLVLNEYLMMRLCKAVGLPVAEVELRHYGHYPTLLVQRFDRKRVGNTVTREYVIDACQALDLPPEYKYERNFGSGRDVSHIRDGASLPRLFALHTLATQPAQFIQQLLDQVLFNLCIHNHDAHGKNFSFFVDQRGLRLTPAYDLVNIAMYPAFNRELAMALGDTFDSHKVYAYQLADFADSCHLPRGLVAKRLKQLAKKILAISPIAPEVGVIRTPAETQFVTELWDSVRTSSEHLLAEVGEIEGIEL